MVWESTVWKRSDTHKLAVQVFLMSLSLIAMLQRGARAWALHPVHRRRIVPPLFQPSIVSGSDSLSGETSARYVGSSRGPTDSEDLRALSSWRSKKLHLGNVGLDEDADKLSAAFDEIAKKDGFDTSSAYFADNESFEDDFSDDDFDFEGDGSDVPLADEESLTSATPSLLWSLQPSI